LDRYDVDNHWIENCAQRKTTREVDNTTLY
jgi:hypothetical protein